VIVVCGSSSPALLSWSVHVAATVASPAREARPIGAVVPLSVTGATPANVAFSPRMMPARSRNLVGTRPLLPVATSFPAALAFDAVAPTALLPSTAPAFCAKFTAAIDVPAMANTSATIDTTRDGEGVRLLIGFSTSQVACDRWNTPLRRMDRWSRSRFATTARTR
jgi:hypothetical protein